MSDAKHSQAPFSVDDTGLILDATGCALARVYGVEDFPCLPEESRDAVSVECCQNACLFAAAPDLLAACVVAHVVVERLKRGLEIDLPHFEATIIAARAKAEGRA